MSKKELVHVFLILGVVVAILYMTGIGCPIRYLSGIPCPGCGLTRAGVSFLQLHVQEAFLYHPLFLCIPLVGVLLLLQEKMEKRIFHFCLTIIILLFIIVYLVRLGNPADTIIKIKLSDGLLYRIAAKIFKGGE